jgi:pyruvate formate lyase activating enzyme
MSLRELFVSGFSDVAETAGFPQEIFPVIFLEGCNFRCPYCINSSLVTKDGLNRTPFQEVVNKYKSIGESKMLISGGEPCYNKDLIDYIMILRESGFHVRLSTNGSLPNVLRKIISRNMVSFFALDIKSGLENEKVWQSLCSEKNLIHKVKESINLLEESHVDFEFRTTMFPNFVQESDIVSISNYINPKSKWFLQQFRKNRPLLDKQMTQEVTPYDDAQMDYFLSIAKKRVINTEIRSV